jgi:hypothetical protein
MADAVFDAMADITEAARAWQLWRETPDAAPSDVEQAAATLHALVTSFYARFGAPREARMAEHEVTWVELSSGRRLDSALLVCPECREMDVQVVIETATWPKVTARDSRGHSWTFVATEANVERSN